MISSTASHDNHGYAQILTVSSPLASIRGRSLICDRAMNSQMTSRQPPTALSRNTSTAEPSRTICRPTDRNANTIDMMTARCGTACEFCEPKKRGASPRRDIEYTRRDVA